MKVSEMIAYLSEFPPDARVIVDGYEDGFNDAAKPQSHSIMVNVNRAWWSGPHDDEGDRGRDGVPVESAVLIERGRSAWQEEIAKKKREGGET